MQLKELIKTINFEGRQVMYIDNMIVWITGLIADLEYKDVNIDNELPSTVITETSIIKKLTGGRRQEIRIERKREHAYYAVLCAKLFFNANKVPDSTDTSSAYYRRIVPIAFPYQFEGKREDRQLLSKLTMEEELPGIFTILMSHLRRILKNNEIHLSETTIEERRMKYERIVNPTNAFIQVLKAFLDEAVDEESTESNMTEKDALYNAYVRFCKKHSLPWDKKETFGKYLKKLGYDEFREGKPSKKGEPRKRYWAGIRLAGEYLLDKEQETII
jgi:phage/plasmid-associated DNA primase